MQELKAGVTDAAVEKHVPVYTIEGSHVHVVVGETKHPMLEEHFIEWITLNTNQGIYRKQLNPGQEPVADFCLCDGEQVEEVYAARRCSPLDSCRKGLSFKCATPKISIHHSHTAIWPQKQLPPT